jgi:hypothetical protein
MLQQCMLHFCSMSICTRAEHSSRRCRRALQEAALAFCGGEVQVDKASRTVTMSKIFKWYGTDFAKEDKPRLAKIAEFCTGEKRDALLELSKSESTVHLKYKDYDWSSNSK